MQTAIVMDNDGTTASFDEEEAFELALQSKRGVDIHQFAYNGIDGQSITSPYQGTFGMYYTSKRYRIFTVSIRIKYGSTTLDKIKTMRSWVDSVYQPLPFKLYYEYIIDTSSFYWVQFIRDSYIEKYCGGELEDYVMNLEFVESQPEGVAVRIHPSLFGS